MKCQLKAPFTHWWTNIAIENCDLWLTYLLKIGIFNNYVSLPESKWRISQPANFVSSFQATLGRQGALGAQPAGDSLGMGKIKIVK